MAAWPLGLLAVSCSVDKFGDRFFGMFRFMLANRLLEAAKCGKWEKLWDPVSDLS